MRKITWLIAVVMVVAFAGTAMAKKAPPKTDKKPPKKMVLKCVVQGTPSEFPNDLYVTNKGNYTLKKGTWVKWEFPGYSKSGFFKLTKKVGPGKGFYINSVLQGGAEAGSKCNATLQKPKKVFKKKKKFKFKKKK